MESLNYFKQQVEASIATKQSLLEHPEVLETMTRAGELCLEAYQNGNQVLLAGNGGSAADAQHIAAEFVSRFEFDRPGLPAQALTTDTSILTAVGNDYGFEKLFARQIQANGKKGDIFIGISTSGKSPNILRAIEMAKQQGLTTIGLAGAGGEMRQMCDICISVPSSHTARIQECHILIGHALCGFVEKGYFQP
ncbi:phosphoheptose isomerase [Photobacterium jeanii]|uniref:Phosphoheptose isomerase n=1 Tax=Photobacterium jeanii TaxID=858640 RepID=A0A178K227_9GAMM|nr:D-sedoheptulose 7-phosphate isomerase [Photobacterium jeanii]OAN11360.1 phosphoheptose isomerase [Photobacterium jeanii]PST90880.1 SIS domain-containing protein [Photobacterium jeanii]